MLVFGLCYVLYLFKFSAGHGYHGEYCVNSMFYKIRKGKNLAHSSRSAVTEIQMEGKLT